MRMLLIPILAAVYLTAAAPNVPRSSSVTTKSLVQKHGYPFEEHEVQTADGYVLTIHRIPYSTRNKTEGSRPVAFLMHGLLCSSSDWVLSGPNSGLAYILSDAGYDVWMGNARGNTYSRKHIKHSSLLSSYWNFDWHEIGTVDIPTMIDYIRYHIGVEKVRYFAHSQGTTAFLLLNALNPKFKSRIISAHLMAPVAFMENMESPLAKIAAPLLGHPNAFVELFGSMEFMPSSKAMELLGYTACRDSSPFQVLCANVLYLISGCDDENLNATMIPEIMATTPAGSSINQIYHYLQEYNSGYFRQFDYGLIRNKVVYGTRKPPDYPIEAIEASIFLYYSDNDYLASVVDVHKLIRRLPKRSLKGEYQVPHSKWNHLDFLWGMNTKKQIYDKIMKDVASIY